MNVADCCANLAASPIFSELRELESIEKGEELSRGYAPELVAG